MSPTTWRGVKLAAVLFAVGVLQAAMANFPGLWGTRPDLLLTASLVGAMFCGEAASALVGFSAALIHASLAAPPQTGVGSVLVSRTLVCFGIGCMEDRLYRDSAIVAVVVVVAGTLATECLYFLFDPQHNLLRWARALLFTVVWNAALAAPCYYVIGGLLGPHRKTKQT